MEHKQNNTVMYACNRYDMKKGLWLKMELIVFIQLNFRVTAIILDQLFIQQWTEHWFDVQEEMVLTLYYTCNM